MAGVTLSPRLRPKPSPDNGSQLLYAFGTMWQRQAAVKLYGVYVSHWGSPAYSPERRVRWVPSRDSGEVVKPFHRPPIKRQGITVLYDGQSYRRRSAGLLPVETGFHTPQLGRHQRPYTSFRTSGLLRFLTRRGSLKRTFIEFFYCVMLNFLFCLLNSRLPLVYS